MNSDHYSYLIYLIGSGITDLEGQTERMTLTYKEFMEGGEPIEHPTGD